MPVNGPRKFQTRFRALSDSTIEEKFKIAKLGPSMGMAMLWCTERFIDLESPFWILKEHDIASMTNAIGLKPLEQERLERAFLGAPRNQLPQMISSPRPVQLCTLSRGNMSIGVKMSSEEFFTVGMCSEDTVAVAKARMQRVQASLLSRPFQIIFAGEVLDDESMKLGDCKVKHGSQLSLQISGDTLPTKLSEAMKKAGLAEFQHNAHVWCSHMGTSSTGGVKAHFDQFATFLQLISVEKCALRSAFGLPQRPVEIMSLEDVAAELAVDSIQFRKHCSVLAKMTRGNAQDVAKYLHGGSVLLTAAQAKQMFDIVFPKASSREGSRYSIRSQLVTCIHSFCVEPYVLWEDDGETNCTWMNMTYNGVELWSSGLCEDLAGNHLGGQKPWGRVKEGSCKGGCGFYPGPNGYCSFCSAGKGPNFPGVVSLGEEARPGPGVVSLGEDTRNSLRRDVSGLRGALKSFRMSTDRQLAFEKLVIPQFYGAAGSGF